MQENASSRMSAADYLDAVRYALQGGVLCAAAFGIFADDIDIQVGGAVIGCLSAAIWYGLAARPGRPARTE